jgi:hypothetical protein
MGFAEDLKAVADSQYEATVSGESSDALHYRGEACDRTASQVISVAEASWQNDAIRLAEILVFVPEHRCVVPEHAA